METTVNLGLKKPDGEDFYSVQHMNDNMDILDEKVQECFQSVSNGKILVASAITDKGVDTASDAAFQTMADNIRNISTGVDTSDDTIIASALLEGYTAHNANKEKIVGTLPDKTGTENYSAVVSLDNDNNRLKMKVPALGKFNTGNYLYAAYSAIANLIGLTASKLVKGNTILGITGDSSNMDTSGGDAESANILAGKKACVDGSLITGTMEDIAGTTVEAGGVTQDDDYTYLDIPAAGYYDTASKVRTLNSNLNNVFMLERKNLNATWDISKVAKNYKNLTIDNFYIGCQGTFTVTHAGYQYWNITVTKTYNASSGVLSVSCSVAGEPGRDGILSLSLPIAPILVI